jgi:hypothetical protein
MSRTCLVLLDMNNRIFGPCPLILDGMWPGGGKMTNQKEDGTERAEAGSNDENTDKK